MSRQVYEQAIIWASKATERTNFWKKQREASKSDSIRITSESCNLLTGDYLLNYVLVV